MSVDDVVSNDCRILVSGAVRSEARVSARYRSHRRRGERVVGRDFHSSTFQLNMSTVCPMSCGAFLISMTKTAQVEQRCARV